jgi:hypothetical protein
MLHYFIWRRVDINSAQMTQEVGNLYVKLTPETRYQIDPLTVSADYRKASVPERSTAGGFRIVVRLQHHFPGVFLTLLPAGVAQTSAHAFLNVCLQL